MQQNKLYVGNLPYSVDEAYLEQLFSSYGNVDEVALIKDRETGRSKGFAFVTFNNQEAAEKALEQNGKELEGRTLRVNLARERTERGGERGGDRGNRSGGGGGRW